MVDSDRPDETPTVLVIEDNRAMADTYEIWLDAETALVSLNQQAMRTRARIDDRLSQLEDSGEAYKTRD